MLRSTGCKSLRTGEGGGPCEHNDEPSVWEI